MIVPLSDVAGTAQIISLKQVLEKQILIDTASLRIPTESIRRNIMVTSPFYLRLIRPYRHKILENVRFA